MPMQWSDWPILELAALNRVTEMLDTGPRGVALIGSEGVGKTTLAGQVAGALGGGDPLWVVGSAAQSSIPFGAFDPLIEVCDVGRPAAMIASAAECVLQRAGSAPLIVDNARLLDPLSASLVYHLATVGRCPLIVTVRSVLRVPQVVSSLWEDGLLGRFDVSPLDGIETAEVLAAAGSDADAALLYRRSAGNPLHLRLLLVTGGTDETLAAAVDRYLSGLRRPVRDLLGYLCVREPLSRADAVALTGEQALAEAEAAGAVLIRGEVYPGHPLFLERLATTLDKVTARRLRGEVAAQLANRPSRSPADRMSRTLLALGAEGPVDTGEVVAAAQEALRLGDLGLAERLAGGALERGGRPAEQFPARLALSYALAWQGRGREADAVLAAVDTDGLSEEQVMAWALPRAANQFWMLSEPERATVFLQTVRQKVGRTASHLTLDALSATFAMNAGNVHRAVEVAAAVLADPEAPEMAVAWAASAASLSSARMGRLGDVDPLVRRALGSEYPGLLRFTVGLAETTTLLMNGQTARALEVARGFTDFAELAQPGRAIGEVLLAQVLLAQGEYVAAAELLEPAAAILARTGYSWGPLALTYLTTALAHQGEIAKSAMALSRAQARHGTKSALFAPELGVARAWRLATIGDRAGAVTAAREAARMARRAGQYAIAVRACHEAARLGDRRAASDLERIAGEVDCRYTALALGHARALAAGDAAALAAASEDLAEAGLGGAARDAAAQARAVSA